MAQPPPYPPPPTKIKMPSVKGEIYKYMMLTRAKSQQYTTSSSSFCTPHTENEIEQDDGPSVVLARKIQFNFFSTLIFFFEKNCFLFIFNVLFFIAKRKC